MRRLGRLDEPYRLLWRVYYGAFPSQQHRVSRQADDYEHTNKVARGNTFCSAAVMPSDNKTETRIKTKQFWTKNPPVSTNVIL
jgi:hypothetical protein